MKKKLKYLIILYIFFLVLVILYRRYDSNDTVTLKINDKTVVFSKKDTSHSIELNTLNNDYDTIIKSIKNIESVKINGKRILFEKNLGKINISKKNRIKIEVKFKGEKKYTKYYINTLPNDFPDFNTKGKSKSKGEYYLTTYSTNTSYVFKLNNSGKIVFYKKTDVAPYLFKKEMINGKTYYSYLEAKVEKEKLNDVLIILNDKYKVIKRIQRKISDETNKRINKHDYLILDFNHFIFADNFSIEEEKDGKILWKYTYENYTNTEDYDNNRHFNAFKIDDDKNLLVSFRDTSEIIKINRKNGEIMWVLGGENNMFDKKIFKYQHAIEKYKDKYIVYSNNVAYDTLYESLKTTPTTLSSLVEFKLDEKNKKITDVEEYALPVLSGILANAYPVNEDVYVISYGAFNGEDNPNFEERNIRTDEVYFSFKYTEKYFVYRVYKY